MSTTYQPEAAQSSGSCTSWAAPAAPAPVHAQLVAQTHVARMRGGVVTADLVAQFRGTGLPVTIGGAVRVAPKQGRPAGAPTWSPPV